MKRVLDLMMTNKYFIFAFTLIVFGTKLLLDKYDIIKKYHSVFDLLKAALLIVAIACFLHILSVFAFAFLSKNKSEPWWEKLENKAKEQRKNNRLELYFQGLTTSIPLALYTMFIYLAVFHSWKHFLMIVIGFAGIRLINHFKTIKSNGYNEKHNGLQQQL
ncbi:MAG TPA: hypothetical protein VF622_10825 [Segetibacter sp.]|jgi:hypothetical protein